jgi:hypothetical protein
MGQADDNHTRPSGHDGERQPGSLPTVTDPTRVEGFPAVTLMAGALEATFVAAAGMVCASLRHHGDELLDARNGVREYAEMGATMGILFLQPLGQPAVGRHL